jgi:hypothetical protein
MGGDEGRREEVEFSHGYSLASHGEVHTSVEMQSVLKDACNSVTVRVSLHTFAQNACVSANLCAISV